MSVYEIIDNIEYELTEIHMMYAEGIISLGEFDQAVEDLIDFENINSKLTTESDKILAEKLISAMLDVYNL